MEQSLSWSADSTLASWDISHNLWNLKIQFYIHKSKINPVNAISSHFNFLQLVLIIWWINKLWSENNISATLYTVLKGCMVKSASIMVTTTLLLCYCCSFSSSFSSYYYINTLCYFKIKRTRLEWQLDMVCKKNIQCPQDVVIQNHQKNSSLCNGQSWLVQFYPKIQEQWRKWPGLQQQKLA